MPDPHSTAGRHAADLARARAADGTTPRFAAVQRLARAIRAHGLPHYADLTQRPNVEPAIGVNVRLDHAVTDEALVFTILDDCGWRITTGRHGAYGHHLFCLHRDTGAEVQVHVKLPHAQVPQWEAA
jgi:hypothetical protein